MCQAKNIFDRQNLLVIAAYGVVKINHIMWWGQLRQNLKNHTWGSLVWFVYGFKQNITMVLFFEIFSSGQTFS